MSQVRALPLQFIIEGTMFIARLGFVCFLAALSFLAVGKWEVSIVLAIIFLGFQVELCSVAICSRYKR